MDESASVTSAYARLVALERVPVGWAVQGAKAIGGGLLGPYGFNNMTGPCAFDCSHWLSSMLARKLPVSVAHRVCPSSSRWRT